jgi:hypothetical protein
MTSLFIIVNFYRNMMQLTSLHKPFTIFIGHCIIIFCVDQEGRWCLFGNMFFVGKFCYAFGRRVAGPTRLLADPM